MVNKVPPNIIVNIICLSMTGISNDFTKKEMDVFHIWNLQSICVKIREM